MEVHYLHELAAPGETWRGMTRTAILLSATTAYDAVRRVSVCASTNILRAGDFGLGSDGVK